MGVQSFSEADLRYLDRPHSADQSLRAVQLLREAGYSNISIDLIFGIPGTDDASWECTLDTAFSLEVPHISAYALTVEERTPLAWRINRQKSAPTDDEQQVRQFRILLRRMKEHGYNHYEISNFCKPGMHAVHNTNYWNGVPYLGLGPSAHSYNGTSRRWNVSNLERYRAGIESGNPVFEEEVLTHEQRINEYIMTSLRTQWGCSEIWVKSEMRETDYEDFRTQVDSFITEGLMVRNASVLFLTEKGKLFADGIAAELFVEPKN
jgi:oxygen-independent coproporphyrinogen-3 oxidase